MLYQFIISFIASLGFGIIFNIRGKNLFFAALGGGISWLLSVIFVDMGLSTVSSYFLSAVAFSLYSEFFARILKTPVTSLVVCALIPLVPGAGMYYTMYAAILNNTEEALSLATSTLENAGSLALGVICVSSLTRQISRIKHILLQRKKNQSAHKI